MKSRSSFDHDAAESCHLSILLERLEPRFEKVLVFQLKVDGFLDQVLKRVVLRHGYIICFRVRHVDETVDLVLNRLKVVKPKLLSSSKECVQIALDKLEQPRWNLL